MKRAFGRLDRPTSGVLLFLAFTAVNVSNFGFHMVTSRALNPASYGALGALLSIMLVLQVPVGALQVAITQQVAALEARRAEDPYTRLGVASLLKRMTVVALIAAAVFVGLSWPLKAFLHLNSLTPGLLLALDMFPLLIGLVPRAVFLGEQKFRPVSIALVLGAATRLVLGYFLGHNYKTVDSAMWATVAGDFVTTALLLKPLKLRTHDDKTVIEALSIKLQDATAAGVAFAGLFLLVGVDTVLARHYLSREASGAYVAAATAARSALFLSTAVGLIVFPRFAAHQGQGPEARAALVRSLFVVVALGVGAAIIISLFPMLFVTLLLGDQYRGAAGIVGTLAFGSAALGVLSLLVYFQLARRSPRAWFPWVGFVVVAGLVSLFSDSMRTIGHVTALSTGVLTLIVLFDALLRSGGESKQRLAQRHRPPLPTLESDLDLSVVVPFYNPGPRFLPSLIKLVEVLREEDITFEVIAVSDGSTDGSAESIMQLHSDVVRSVVLPENWGKGEALRVGLSMGRGQYLGFIDADGDIDASLFKPFLALIRAYEPDIVLGSKRHPMSEVEYPALRRIYSWGYQQFIRLLFHLDVKDTQTGLKLVRREVLANVLPRMVERRFAFDLELFVVARRLGYRKVFEAPIRIGTRFTSTVSKTAVLAMFHDTFEIFYRLHVLHSYDVDPAHSYVWDAPPDAIEVRPASDR